MGAGFPEQLPESAAVPVVHHVLHLGVVGSVSAFFRLEVIESGDVVILLEHLHKVLEECRLSGW